MASILATLIISLAFAMVTSANAAPPDKKIEVKDKNKIEKVEKEDEEEVEEMEEIGEAEEAELEALGLAGANRILKFDKIRLDNVIIKIMR